MGGLSQKSLDLIFLTCTGEGEEPAETRESFNDAFEVYTESRRKKSRKKSAEKETVVVGLWRGVGHLFTGETVSALITNTGFPCPPPL